MCISLCYTVQCKTVYIARQTDDRLHYVFTNEGAKTSNKVWLKCVKIRNLLYQIAGARVRCVAEQNTQHRTYQLLHTTCCCRHRKYEISSAVTGNMKQATPELIWQQRRNMTVQYL
jgi:hypothetical protein